MKRDRVRAASTGWARPLSSPDDSRPAQVHNRGSLLRNCYWNT